MPATLHAVRYAATPLTNPDILEYIADPADVGIRWSLPGGLQKLVVRVKARNNFDRYNRYQNHHGQRIAIFDSTLDAAVAVGFIYEIRLLDNGVEYICAGAWQRHKQELDTTIYNTLSTITAVLQDVLTNHVEVANADQANIETNTTPIGGWQPNLRGGRYPADIISDLVLMSDSSDNRYDYYLRPFAQGTRLEKHLPVFEKRDPAAAADWVVSTTDLNSLDLSRNIWNLTTDFTVFYGFITGTATGGSTTTLVDAGAGFDTLGVQPGDQLFNITNNESAAVISVLPNTLTVATMTTPNTAGDAYSVQLQNSTASTTATPATADFWTVERVENQNRLTATQAGQYAQAFVDEFSVPVQQQAFVVSSRRIRSEDGVTWPLWEVIKRGGGYIRIDDINPVANQLSERLDSLQAFKIIALDYKLSSNSLRVALDESDNRLDTILQKAVSNQTQIVSVEQ